MKLIYIILIPIIVSSCSSSNNYQHSSYKKNPYINQSTSPKLPFNACVNKGVIVNLFAKFRDAGKNVRMTKEYGVFDKIKEGNSTVAERILRIVENNPTVKPEVLSSAFAVHCYAPRIPTPYSMGRKMGIYSACNQYSGNTLAIGSCVRRLAGVSR